MLAMCGVLVGLLAVFSVTTGVILYTTAVCPERTENRQNYFTDGLISPTIVR